MLWRPLFDPLPFGQFDIRWNVGAPQSSRVAATDRPWEAKPSTHLGKRKISLKPGRWDKQTNWLNRPIIRLIVYSLRLRISLKKTSVRWSSPCLLKIVLWHCCVEINKLYLLHLFSQGKNMPELRFELRSLGTHYKCDLFHFTPSHLIGIRVSCNKC